MERFGAYLRALRLKIGKGLREFSSECEIDPGNLSKIETGKMAPPTGDLLERIATALQLVSESTERRLFETKAAVERSELPEETKVLLSDEELLQKLPAFARLLKDKNKTLNQQMDEIIQLVREGKI